MSGKPLILALLVFRMNVGLVFKASSQRLAVADLASMHPIKKERPRCILGRLLYSAYCGSKRLTSNDSIIALRNSWVSSYSPAAIICTAKLPSEVPSTGPANTGTPQTDAVI